MGLALLGLPFLLRNFSWKAATLVAPLLAGVLTAMFRLLPMDGRVALYMGWPILLFSIGGARALRTWLPGWTGRIACSLVVVAGSALAVGIAYYFQPPYRSEEARPVLEELSTRWRPGDTIYAYRDARHAMSYYGPRLGFDKWTQGQGARGDIRARFRELDEFRGRRRVWFFYTHSASRHKEAEAIRSYLDAIGKETDRIDDPFGNSGRKRAAAHLFDLSDATRLTSATAESHPLYSSGDL